MERRLFIAQRASAVILGPLVIVHLALILLAVRGGLSAEEIVARTEGSVWWVLFYGVFVVAVAIHAAIGLRNVLREWTTVDRALLDWSMALFSVLLLALGLRSIVAIL